MQEWTFVVLWEMPMLPTREASSIAAVLDRADSGGPIQQVDGAASSHLRFDPVLPFMSVADW